MTKKITTTTTKTTTATTKTTTATTKTTTVATTTTLGGAVQRRTPSRVQSSTTALAADAADDGDERYLANTSQLCRRGHPREASESQKSIRTGARQRGRIVPSAFMTAVKIFYSVIFFMVVTSGMGVLTREDVSQFYLNLSVARVGIQFL